jgi:hypothetical protein
MDSEIQNQRPHSLRYYIESCYPTHEKIETDMSGPQELLNGLSVLAGCRTHGAEQPARFPHRATTSDAGNHSRSVMDIHRKKGRP